LFVSEPNLDQVLSRLAGRSIDHVSSVRRRGASQLHHQVDRGRSGRSFTSKDKGAVEAKRAELLQLQGEATTTSVLHQLPALGGLKSLPAWNAAIEETTRCARSALIAGDGASLQLLRRFQTMLVELAGAWQRNAVYSDLEQALNDLTAFVESLFSGRKQITDAPEALEPAASVGAVLHPCGPVDRPVEPVRG